MGAHNEVENAVEPRVKFQGRKRTNSCCGIVFLIGFLIHLGLGFVYIADTSRKVVDPATEFPDACKDHYCYYVSSDCASEREMRVWSGHLEQELGECKDRCGSGYRYWTGHFCVKESTPGKICPLPFNRRQLEAQTDPSELSVDEVMVDSIELMLSSVVLIMLLPRLYSKT